VHFSLGEADDERDLEAEDSLQLSTSG
jgi:hypothetical protein